MNDDSRASASRWRTILEPWFDWRRKRCWLLVAFVLYTLLGFLAVPWLVERVFVDTLADTGRKASVAKVRSNPFLFTLEIEDAAIRDTDDAELVSLDRLFVDVQSSSLFRWAATFRQIQLEGPRIHEERFEGLDTRVVRLLDDLAGDEPAGKDDNPPRLVVMHFRLSDGNLHLLDRTAGDYRTTFGPINVDVHDIRTLPDNEGQHAVSVDLGEGDVIRWEGDLHLVPFRSSGRLALEGHGLEDVVRYVDHFLPFETRLDGIDMGLTYSVDPAADGDQLVVEDIAGTVDGVEVTLDDSDDVVLGVGQLALSGGRLAWPSSVARMEDISMRGLSITAERRADGSISLLDLVPETSMEQAGERGADTAQPWRIEVGRLVLPDAQIDVTDRMLTPEAEVSLTGLALILEGIDNTDGTTMPLRLRSTLSTGGDIGYGGTVTVLPAVSADGRFRMDRVALGVVQPYVTPILNVTIEDGRLDLDADTSHGPGQPLALAGSLRIDGFDLADTLRSEKLLAWETLTLDRFELDLAGRTLQTSEVQLNGLFGRLHIAEDTSTNVGDLLVASPGQASNGAEAAEREVDELDVTVGGVRLDDAQLDFSDYSLPLPFATSIQALDGGISTLSTASSTPANVSLEGQVNEFGSARIEGEIDAWSPLERTDIGMRFRNLEMARLTPYTVQFAGYEIDGGRLDMDLAYRLDARRMKGDNNIVIREIQLGDKVEQPGAGNLPLGLAVALLKDADGVIDVDVPVEGDLDDPKFRIGGVIWKAIGNLITRAVTAPFRLLGALVGVDDEDFGTLAFAPGRAEVSPPDREKLAKLGDAMLQRPALVLEVSGAVSAEVDRPALQRQQLEARIAAWETDHPGDADELSTQRARRALEALFTEAFPAESLDALRNEHTVPPRDGEQTSAEPRFDETAYLAALDARLVANQPVGEAELEALAESRARAVVETLSSSHPDAGLNITVGAPQSVDANEDGAVPVELGVEAGEAATGN